MWKRRGFSVELFIFLSLNHFALVRSLEDECPYRSENCDMLVIAEISSVTETIVTVQNVEYLQLGTSAPCRDKINADSTAVQFLVNWSAKTGCYNSTFLALGRSYLFCSYKDKWERCHISTDAPVILASRLVNKKQLRHDMGTRIKRQETGGMWLLP